MVQGRLVREVRTGLGSFVSVIEHTDSKPLTFELLMNDLQTVVVPPHVYRKPLWTSRLDYS